MMLFNRPVIVAVGLVSLIVVLLHGLGGDTGGDGQARASAVPAGQAVPVRGATGWPQAMAAGSQQARTLVPSTQGTPVSPQARRRAALREAFEQADDLYVFLHSLLPDVAAGDADAAWMASRVYEYCEAAAIDPAAYARDTGAMAAMRLEASASLVRARERVGHRCRQFVPADGVGHELVLLHRLLAAEAGSLAAEAALLAMGEPLDEEADYRRDLVQRVQGSGDPEAFSALAPAMGLAASGDMALAGQVAGTPAAELAWQLAACELGLDCSQQGALMTNFCANGGICSRNESQDFRAFALDAALPPGEEEVIDELIDSLLGEGVAR